MDYREICMEIFGTEDIEELKMIARKARKYELFCKKGEVVNSRGAGRKPKVGEETIRAMKEMYAKGTGVGQIAKEFHLTRPTVYKYLQYKKLQEEEKKSRIQVDFMYEDSDV